MALPPAFPVHFRTMRKCPDVVLPVLEHSEFQRLMFGAFAGFSVVAQIVPSVAYTETHKNCDVSCCCLVEQSQTIMISGTATAGREFTRIAPVRCGQLVTDPPGLAVSSSVTDLAPLFSAAAVAPGYAGGLITRSRSISLSNSNSFCVEQDELCSEGPETLGCCQEDNYWPSPLVTPESFSYGASATIDLICFGVCWKDYVPRLAFCATITTGIGNGVIYSPVSGDVTAEEFYGTEFPDTEDLDVAEDFLGITLKRRMYGVHVVDHDTEEGTESPDCEEDCGDFYYKDEGTETYTLSVTLGES